MFNIGGWIAALFVVVGVALAHPEGNSRGCLYIHGVCQSECEVGTKAYVSDCGYLTPEATCDEPNPQPDTRGQICGFSACYCEAPTVRDPVTNKCIPYEECGKQE